MASIDEIVRRQRDVIFRLNMKKGYTFISENVQELLGYSPEDYYNDPVFYRKITLEEDLPRVEKMIENLAKNIEPPEYFTFRQYHSAGKVVYLEFTFITDKDDNGNILAIEGVARDVTVRKEAEKELQEKIREVGQIGETIANGFLAMSKQLDGGYNAR